MMTRFVFAALSLLFFSGCDLVPVASAADPASVEPFQFTRDDHASSHRLVDAYAFLHHKLLSRKTTASGGSWSNTKSCKYAGTATGTAARTNWGQPTAWCVNLSTNALSFSYWFKSNTGGANNADGALLTAADSSSNSHMRMGTSGTAINNLYAGGQFVYTSCSATITANTWTLVTMAFDGSGGVKVYVGNSSTSCIGAFTGVSTDLCTRDFMFNTLRGSTNADVSFGEWGTPNLDEMTVWSVALSGTDHTNLISSGHAIDPTTHAQAGSLIAYYRCGDDATDSTTLLNDQIGAVDGTHSGSDGVTYPSDVP